MERNWQYNRGFGMAVWGYARERCNDTDYHAGYDAGLRAVGEAMVAIARRRKAGREKK